MSKPQQRTNAPPGKGWWGWLGRQVGYVKQAVQTDAAPKSPLPARDDQPVFRRQRVHEAPHPQDPSVVLRRTVIDEAVRRPAPPPGPTRSDSSR